MKIGISSPYLHTLGGGERYLFTLASCLADEHSVSVFTSDFSIIRQAEERFSLDLSSVNAYKDIFYREGLFAKLGETKEFDLIIFLSDGSVPFSMAARNIIHFQRPFRNTRGKSVLNKMKLKNVDAVIVNSNFTKKFIDTEYGIDSKVIYPPVEVEQFSPGEKEKIILSVGRFHEFKKQAALIDVYKKLMPGLADWRLILAGGLLEENLKYFNALQKQAEGYNITLMPDLPFEKLKELYAKASLYWHAAGYGSSEEKDPDKMEHFGITAVEAMSAGCIPLVYKGGGLKEIIRHDENGLFWTIKEELVENTRTLIEDSSLWKKLSLQAQKDSKKYSKNNFCKQIKKLIDKYA